MSELFRYIDFPDEPAEFHSAAEELDAALRDTSDLRAWYREDIARLITALHYLNRRQTEMEYSAGFNDALKAIALACGIIESL